MFDRHWALGQEDMFPAFTRIEETATWKDAVSQRILYPYPPLTGEVEDLTGGDGLLDGCTA